MVRVSSSMFRSKTPFVQVEIQGISEVLRTLRETGKDIETAEDLALAKAGNFVQQEVQESIIGRRAETKSVDTGAFANSISLDLSSFQDGQITIYPDNISYAEYLEYGTTKMTPRYHFRNTKNRTEPKVKEFFDEEIKKKIK